MAKVTDIQDKNGATREIQDKDLANRTSQSSMASSDYVLLEDTNGAYHKIAKASFTEAVRGALGSVINSVAKGTDIAKVPVLDSNNDLGMGTLSNLASVLGVQIYHRLTSGQDLNDLYGNGLYVYEIGDSTGILNVPSTDASWSTLLCVCSAGNQYTQIINGSTGHFVRHKDGTGNWNPWEELSTDIPTFYKDYSNLSSLATALGVAVGDINSGDLNDYKTEGDWDYGYDISNAPVNTARLKVIVRSGRVVQIVYPTDVAETAAPYIRNWNNGAWTPWKRFTLTNI